MIRTLLLVVLAAVGASAIAAAVPAPMPEPKPLASFSARAEGMKVVQAQWMEFAASETLLAMRYVHLGAPDATVAVYNVGTGKPVASAAVKKGGGELPPSTMPCGVSPKGEWVAYGEEDSLAFLAVPPHKPKLPGGGRITFPEPREHGLVGVWVEEKGESALVTRNLNQECDLERLDLAKGVLQPARRWVRGPLAESLMILSVPAGRVAVAEHDPETRERKIVCSTLGEKRDTIRINTQITAASLAFSGDGKTLYAGRADGSVAWYDTATGKCIKETPRLGRFSVGSVAVHPKGKHIACGTWDAKGANVFLLNATSGDVLANLTVEKGVLRVCFSPSGDRLAVFASSGDVTIWDAFTLLKLKRG